MAGSHGGNCAWQLCWCMRGHSTDSWIHTSHPLIVPLVHAWPIWLPACLTSLRSFFSPSDLLHISSHLYFRITIRAGLVGRWDKEEDYVGLVQILYLCPGSVFLYLFILGETPASTLQLIIQPFKVAWHFPFGLPSVCGPCFCSRLTLFITLGQQISRSDCDFQPRCR